MTSILRLFLPPVSQIFDVFILQLAWFSVKGRVPYAVLVHVDCPRHGNSFSPSIIALFYVPGKPTSGMVYAEVIFLAHLLWLVYYYLWPSCQ